MKLRCNSSFRVVKIEILLNPGDEIEVPDETGEKLVRAYESRLVEVTAKTRAKPKKSALERAGEEGQEAQDEAVKAQEAADAAATAEPPKRRPRKKSTAKRSTAKRSTAKKPAAALAPPADDAGGIEAQPAAG